jgi:hypothetical protein
MSNLGTLASNAEVPLSAISGRNYAVGTNGYTEVPGTGYTILASITGGLPASGHYICYFEIDMDPLSNQYFPKENIARLSVAGSKVVYSRMRTDSDISYSPRFQMMGMWVGYQNSGASCYCEANQQIGSNYSVAWTSRVEAIQIA